MTVPMTEIVLPPLTGEQAAAWDALAALAPELGDGWTLIGGQMVLLHQAERDSDQQNWAPRWSYDLDVIVDIRARRGHMDAIDTALRQHGFAQTPQSIEHRYQRPADNVVIDVLAPDHLGPICRD